MRKVDYFYFKVLLASLTTGKDITGKWRLMSILREGRNYLQTLLLWRKDTAIYSSTKHVLGDARQNIGELQ